MKLKLQIILLFTVSALAAQKIRVSFQVTYTKPYCGGARPTDEMQKDAEKPNAYANKILIFINDKQKIDSVKTDKNGFIKIRLKKGKYRFFEAWRYNLYTPSNLAIESFDRACLLVEWQRAYMTLELSRKISEFIVLNPIQESCEWDQPCLLESVTPPAHQ